MSTTTQELFIEVLSLPAQERAALAHRLLVSLEEQAVSSSIEAAWKEEGISRCEAFDAGRLNDRDAAEVLRDAYRKLG